MVIVEGLLATAWTCAAMFGALASPAPATDKPVEPVASVEARSQATNNALLQSLIQRRAEIVQSSGTPDDKRATLEFLDRRIAEVKGRLEK